MRVLVLLSTWNGASYLPAQLSSLQKQEFPGDLRILVRDDGSSDGTIAYLRQLEDPRIELVQGKNLGPRASFFALLDLARMKDADFVALCDQDDVWQPDKIARATALLGNTAAGLYASRLALVDDELRPIGTFTHPGNRSFASTLMCNFVTGCSCVMNRAFLHDLPFPPSTNRVIMHDWWLASIATLGARIVYDDTPTILYRQHAGNHVGIKTGPAKIFAKVREAFGNVTPTRFDHARQLLAVAEKRLKPQDHKVLQSFLRGERSWWQRLRFVLSHRTQIGIARIARFVVFG